MLSIKLGSTIGYALIAELLSQQLQGESVIPVTCFIAGNVGWFATGWNLVQIGLFEQHMRNGNRSAFP